MSAGKILALKPPKLLKLDFHSQGLSLELPRQ
jgi:hypothetical protein